MSLSRLEGESRYGEWAFSRVGEVAGRGLRGWSAMVVVLQGEGMSVSGTTMTLFGLHMIAHTCIQHGFKTTKTNIEGCAL